MTSIRTRTRNFLAEHKLALAFVVAFVAAIEFLFGWAELVAPWKRLDSLSVCGIALVLGSTYVLRGLRLYRYFRSELAFFSSLRTLLQHNLWTVLLPARTGEISFPVIMHRQFGIPASRSVPILLWFRALDAHSLLLIVGLVWLWRYAPLLAIPFALCWTGLLAAVVLSRHPIASWLRGKPGPWANKCRQLIEEAPPAYPKLVESWFWSVTSWSIKMLLFAWVISAFTSANLLPSMFGALGGEVSSALPVHGIAGVGSYQSGVALAMLPFGVGLEDAVRGGINLHLLVLGGALVAGVLAHAVPALPRRSCAW